MKPFFGYYMPSFTFPGVADVDLFEQAAALACAAEEAGFDLVAVMDHFYQVYFHGTEAEPMLEAYSVLAALAARTNRVKLGTMVTGVTYRNPAMLAKTVTTLDVISKGRAVLGLGAAWNEDEHTGYGFDFPPIGERLDRLEEALRICKLMFTEDAPSFQGRHYRIASALNIPRPIQPGGPPILVGGSGEQRTLRIVARYADMSNWWGSMEELRHYSEVLDRHCEVEGRDPTTILRTVMSPFALVASHRDAEATLGQLTPARRAYVSAATPEEAAAALEPYLAAGFGGIIFRNTTMKTVEQVGLAGELIRLMR